MKHTKLWMLAAILIICGARVLTACTSNEDNAVTKDNGHALHGQPEGQLS